MIFGFQLDSLEKLNKLLDACKALGVEINPMVINELGNILLFSWYHEVIVLSHHFDFILFFQLLDL